MGQTGEVTKPAADKDEQNETSAEAREQRAAGSLNGHDFIGFGLGSAQERQISPEVFLRSAVPTVDIVFPLFGNQFENIETLQSLRH